MLTLMERVSEAQRYAKMVGVRRGVEGRNEVERRGGGGGGVGGNVKEKGGPIYIVLEEGGGTCTG